MKKVLAILLALTMALSLCSTAWATDGVVETEGEANSPVAQENGIVVAEGEANAPVVQEGATTPTYVAQIGETKYETLAAAVAAAGKGAVITLLGNCQGEGISVAGDKDITIDFAGYTYTLTKGAGSKGTRTNGFQLLMGSKVVMKNGKVDIIADNKTVEVADPEVSGRLLNVMRFVQSYADVMLTNMVFDAANLYNMQDYALSFNKGNVLINGNTTVLNYPDTKILFDSCDGSWASSGVYSTDPVTAITIDTTGTLPGKVAMGGGHLNVNKGTVNVVLDSNSPDLTVGKDANVTLDLAGKALTGPTSDTITNNGTLTIKDSSTAKTGKINSAEGKAPLNNSANVTVEASAANALAVNNVAGSNAAAKLGDKTYIGEGAIQNAAKSAQDKDTLEIIQGSVSLTGVASGVIVSVASGASATVNNTSVSAGTNYTVPASGEASKNAAKIGTTEYRTLAEAVAAANAGDTITLLNNVTLDSALVIKKDCKLDLGGKTLSRTGGYVLDIYSNVTITNGTVNITGASSQKNNTCAIWLNDNAKLTVDSTAKITTTNDNNIGNFAIGLDQSCNGAELIFNGEINAANGITVNGNIKAPKTNTLTINGKITATEHALYLAGNAATTVNSSAQLTGNTGIEIRAGKLNVAGGSVTSKGTYTAAPNGRGGTTEGAAIAVAQHTTKQAIEVNITGGVISADATGKAIAVSDPQGNNLDNVKVNVKGGTVNGAVLIEKNIAAKKPASVTGGIFTDNVTSLVPATTPIAKITIGGKTTFVVGAENIQNVAKTAKSGDVIEITQGNVTLTGIAGGVTVKTPGDAAATVNGTAVTAKAYPNGYTVPTYTGGGTGGGFPSSGTKKDDTKKDIKSATTFDAGIALYVGMSILSLTGTAAVIGKKKEF